MSAFDDSQISSSPELVVPDSPVYEASYQQAQPDVDLANELPEWLVREQREERQKGKEAQTTPQQQTRKRYNRIESSDSSDAECSSDEESEGQQSRRRHSSDEDLKSLIKTLCKKVKKNEEMLKALVNRYVILSMHVVMLVTLATCSSL